MDVKGSSHTMNDFDDTPRYRKRSHKKTPHKADHKHEFVNCVYGFPELRLDEAHGFVNDGTRLSIGTYCPVCGKIGAHFDPAWREPDEVPKWHHWLVGGSKWSAKAEAEFDERTRTLPFFRIHDMFKQKYVE